MQGGPNENLIVNTVGITNLKLFPLKNLSYLLLKFGIFYGQRCFFCVSSIRATKEQQHE